MKMASSMLVVERKLTVSCLGKSAKGAGDEAKREVSGEGSRLAGNLMARDLFDRSGPSRALDRQSVIADRETTAT
jgi:hypothetical protein